MKFVRSLLSAAIVAGSVGAAHAQEGAAERLQRGPYVILEGGWNATAPTTTYNGFISANNRVKLKQGWALSGAGGYKFLNGLRTELEFSYHRNNFKDFDYSAKGFSGRQVTGSVMLNVLYDVNTGTRITPFFGGGVGGTMVWMKDLTQLYGPSAPILGVLNNESMRVAFQGIIGAAFAIGPQFEMILDTRYRVSNGHTFSQPTVGPVPNSFIHYNVHELTVMAGLRYAF